MSMPGCYRIPRHVWLSAGGLMNPKLARKQIGSSWTYWRTN